MEKTIQLGAVVLWSLMVSCFLFISYSRATSETIDEVYKKALKEKGVLNCYCSLAQINAVKIYPAFEKRFPGIRINHVDATSDKLAVRAITEARGGRVIADVLEFGIENIVQVHEQKLLLEKLPPEAAAYPANLKGSFWIANNLIFFVGAWNTNLVKKQDEPKSLDDFADPKWKGKLIAEPRDTEILIGLAHKHKSLEKSLSWQSSSWLDKARRASHAIPITIPRGSRREPRWVTFLQKEWEPSSELRS